MVILIATGGYLIKDESTSEYAFLHGGDAISWSTKKHYSITP